MKKISVLISALLCAVLLSGYSSCSIDDDATMNFAIKMVATEIGCEASKLNSDVDFMLRNLYGLAVSGQLTPEAMNRIVAELSDKLGGRPTLVLSLIDLIEMIGAGVSEDRSAITETAGISEEFLKAISSGYVRGYDVCSVL
jgi:hypothetical protein